jgi:hypothetical protein
MRNVGLDSGADLLEGDRRLGREADIGRQAGVVAPDRIRRPVPRRIEPIRHRQARAVTAASGSTLFHSPGSNKSRQ